MDSSLAAARTTQMPICLGCWKDTPARTRSVPNRMSLASREYLSDRLLQATSKEAYGKMIWFDQTG